VHITPVDLRWGVTEEETQQALEICLGEIDNCRPFFIGLLGRRYGWCPDEYVAPDEPRYDWLRHFPSGYSITHLEMYARSRPRLCTVFLPRTV
jgi:telomerase protein component 1